MVEAARESADFRFLTDDWPEPERRKVTWELYGRIIWPAEFEPLPEGPVYIDARFCALPGLHIADVTCSSARRARRTCAHASDDLALHICQSGSRTLSQRGRDETIGYGEAILTSGAEASATAVSSSRFITFRVPAPALAARVPNIQDHVARPIRRRAATQLLTGYAAMLQNPRALPTVEARRLAVAQIYDLMAQAIRPSEAAAETGRDARASRLRAIKANLLESLGSDISIASVAARHRLPVRYVQRLFESEGSSFTEYLVEQRLLRAHRMLTDPRLASRQVGLIAFESGFAHLPYFNRAFRARFGDTPTGVRTRARHADVAV